MTPQTTPRLVCLPYHAKDVGLAKKLLDWIEELSPKLGPHCCLLAADASVPHETKTELGNQAKRIFHFAETAIIPVPSNAVGWPQASNAMFRTAAQHIKECFKLPWFWMEPDCTPMRPSWLDELAVHYAACPKRYMGAVIQSNQPPMPPLHLAGCAVYPADAYETMNPFTTGDKAWDIASAPYVIPQAMNTPLIHHHYGEMTLPPTFKEAKLPGDPINTCVLDFVRPDAAVFHRTKDGTLIDLLRKQRHSIKTSPAAEPLPASEAPKRGPGRPRKVEPITVSA
jgi:hypothetical protein